MGLTLLTSAHCDADTMIAAVTAIKPFPVSARLAIPASIERPHYVDKPAPERYRGSHVQSAETIEQMRVAGRIAAQAMLEAVLLLDGRLT